MIDLRRDWPCWAFLLAFTLLAHSSSSAQVTRLEYRFGDSGQNNYEGTTRSRNMIEGWNALWGGDKYGTLTGQIGDNLPPTEVSRRALQREEERKTFLEGELRRLRAAVPQVAPAEFLDRYTQEQEVLGLKRYQQTQAPDDLYFGWRTTNPDVKAQLGALYYALRTSQPTDPRRAELATIGIRSIRLADESYSVGDPEDASFFFSVAKATADILVGIDPVTGAARSLYEAIVGIDLFTEAELSPFERGFAVFGVVTLGYGPKVRKGLDALSGLLSKSRLARASWASAKAFAENFSDAFRAFIAGREETAEELLRYLSVLREAAEGPRLRMEALARGSDDLTDSVLRRYPELYKPEVKMTQDLPLQGYREFRRVEAEALGKAWVGDGARLSYGRAGNPVGLLSSDERRFYRFPALKDLLGREQANLEMRGPNGNHLSNFHIEIID